MTLAFSPLGLGGRLAPADAASFQAASIAQAVLADDVPEDVRNNFERARKLHLHGVLEYEFFTAASEPPRVFWRRFLLSCVCLSGLLVLDWREAVERAV